jgi:predicted RNase H-like HicB family nuclease
MSTRKNSKRERTARLENRYAALAMDKPDVVHQGETVEDFLARGGEIKKIVKLKMPKKNDKGKFVKGSMIEVQVRTKK